MFERKHMYKKSIYRNFIQSYLLIVTVFFVSIIIFAGYSNNYLQKHINEQSMLLTANMRASVEDAFSSLDNLATRIFMDDSINSVKNMTAIDGTDNRWNIYQLERTLIDNKSVYPFVKSVAVYFPNIDYLVCDEGTGISEYTYKRYLIDEKTPQLDSWKKEMDNRYVHDIYRSGDNLIYLQSFMDNEGNNQMVLMILIQPENLIRLLDVELLNQNGSLMVLDKEKKLLFTSNDSQDYNIGNDVLEKMQNGVHTVKSEKNTLTVSYLGSSKNNLFYAYIIERAEYYREVVAVTTVVIICLLVLFFLGWYLAVHYSRKHYKPIQTIVESISEADGFDDLIDENEYLWIEAAVKRYERDRKFLKEENNRFMFNNLITMKLQTYYSKNTITDTFENFEVKFFYQYYAAVSVSINDILEADGKSVTDIGQYMQKLVNENLRDGIHGMVFVITADQLFILIGADEDKEVFYNKLKESLYQIQSEAQKRREVVCSMIVSEIYENLNDTPDIFKKITELIFANYYEDVVFAQNVLKSPIKEFQWPNKDYFACVINADYIGAKTLVEQYIAQIDIPQYRGREYIEFVKFDIMNSLTAIAKDWYDSETFFKIRELFIYSGKTDIGKIKGKTLEATQLLIDARNKDAGLNKNRDLIQNVKEYIQDNLSNPDLSVSMLGEQFHFASGYLSKIFKLQTNERLKDYIMNKKIEKTKELLKGTDLKILEIAKQVGFSEITVFNRAFKQTVGVSPSQYRNLK